jgi:hypothetical protein
MRVGGKTVGELDIMVHHDASDVGQPTPNLLTLSGGELHATFVPLRVA